MSAAVTSPDAALPVRYAPEAFNILDADERARFLDAGGAPRNRGRVAWELLYRLEPALYERLVAGERLHDGVLGWLPRNCGRVLEVGAGTGRLTMELASRAESLVAVEPAAPLRDTLRRRLDGAGFPRVDVVRGFFDDLDVPAAAFDLVISCSAFAVDAVVDADRCLASLASRCAAGGRLVLVWPSDVAWLEARGFEHVVFAGPMLVEYASVDEAVALSRVFYPDAVRDVADAGSRFVDFATLGINAPRDLCWRRCP